MSTEEMQLGLVKIVSPRWDMLAEDFDSCLCFGTNPYNEWKTIDIKDGPEYDLLSPEWPWSDLSVIHCVSMLYQWDYEDVIGVLKRCHESLRSGGVLWLGERRPGSEMWDGSKYASVHTPNSLMRMAEKYGFSVDHVETPIFVTGRPSMRCFALKCTK